MYKCPKCGSSKTIKEKIKGMDTMDRICQDCNYIGSKQEFIIDKKNIFDNEKTNNK